MMQSVVREDSSTCRLDFRDSYLGHKLLLNAGMHTLVLYKSLGQLNLKASLFMCTCPMLLLL